MKTVLLYSGGIDSTVLLYDLIEQGDTVMAVGFDYDQPHRIELQHADDLCAAAGVPYEIIPLELGWLGVTVDGLVFPNRNSIFVSVAAGFAMSRGYESVAIAPHAGDYADFPDCRPGWVHAMNDVLRSATAGAVSLRAPYLTFTKAELVALGRRLGAPLDATWSCYGPGPEPCGTCLACTSRREALACS